MLHIKIIQDGILVSQATKSGYAFCEWGGVCDLSYPSSKNRRARTQENGKICGALTGNCTQYKVEKWST